MALQYPTFAFAEDDFVCLKKDLSAVKWFLEWQELQDNLSLSEAELSAFVHSNGLSHSELIERIVQAADQSATDLNDEARKSELHLLANKFSSLSTINTPSVGMKYKMSSIMNDIKRMYSRTNTTQLRADLSELFAVDSPEQTAIVDQLKILNRNRNRLVKQIAAHRKLVVSTLASVPENFRGVKCPEETDEAAYVTYCVQIVTAFVSVWKQRAKSFACAVTHKGIALDSMPAELSSIWHGAYMALEFNKLTKHPVYVPQKYPEASVKRSPVLQDFVSE